jgi:hypothetical protein
MSEPDRSTSSDPSTAPWHDQDDPEATRVVRRTPPPDDDDAAMTQQVSNPEAAATGDPGTPIGDAARHTSMAGDAGAGIAPESAWPVPPAAEHGFGDGSPAPGAASGFVTGGTDAPSDPVTGTPSAPSSEPVTGAPAGSPFGPVSGAQQGVDHPRSGPTGPSGAPYDLGPDAGPTSTMPPSGGVDPQATSYLGAPTVAYPGPGATGPQPGSPVGYSYRPGYGPGAPGSGPQLVPPSATASVTLPPVRMPKAESRVALNTLGGIVGLILVAGGLVLVALYAAKMRVIDSSALGSGSVGDIAGSATIDVLPVVLTIVGILLVAVAALISAWASWAAILPGFLLAAVSVWAMITTGPNSGGVLIDKGTSWAFKDGQFAAFCMSGSGLLVGLLLFFAGLAAVFLRAGVRRTIRQQLESIQA